MVRHAVDRVRLRAVSTSVTAATVVMVMAAGCGGGGKSPAQGTRTVTKTPAPATVTASETSGSSEPPSPGSEARYLNELEPLTSTQGVDNSAAEINGRGYARSVTLTTSAAGPVNSVEYNLGRHWRTFTATIGLRDDSPTGGVLTFEVTVDGARKQREKIPLGESREIELDVSDALRLGLTVTYSGQDAGNYYYGSWGDAQLSRP